MSALGASLLMSAHVPAPEQCPVCGASVPRAARACPECGADERSGWNEDATRYDGLDLPDEGNERTPRSAPGRSLWIAVAVGLVVLLILGLFLR